MTTEELAQCAPKIAALRQKLEKSLTGMLHACGVSYAPGDGEIPEAEFLVLAAFQEVQRLRRDCQPAPAGGDQWEFLARTVIDSVPHLIFKSNKGGLAHLRAGFVAAFLRNETLAANLIESPFDVGIYLVQRGNVTESEVPTSLLDYLLALRRKGAAAGFLNAVDTTDILRGSIGEGSSHPAACPTQRQLQVDSQPEQSHAVGGAIE